MSYPLFAGLGGWEIAIIALVILLIFGGRKIPELMRGLGKGIKNFKEGIKESDAEKPEDDLQKQIKAKEEEKS